MKKVLLLTCFALAAAQAFAQKTAPKLLNAVSPGYPQEMADSGYDGIAEVDIVVKADGSVADAQLAMATERAFGRLALAAVKLWKFEPGKQDGVAIDQKVSIPFRFTAPTDQKVNALAKRKVFAEIAEPVLTEKDYPVKKLKVKRAGRLVYPREMMGKNASEKVQVSFVVGPDGRTMNPTVLGLKNKEFELPALDTVAATTYEPPVKDGKPVYVAMTTTLDFSPAGGARRGGGGGGGSGGGFGGGGGGGGGFGGGGGGFGGGGDNDGG